MKSIKQNTKKKQKLKIVTTSPVEKKQKFAVNEQVCLNELSRKFPCWDGLPIRVLSVMACQNKKVLLSDLCWYSEDCVESLNTPKTFVHPSRCD